MKKILFLATALVMLTSCADESFVGENIAPTSKDVGAIAFTTSSNAVTRAEGGAAAGLLNNNFVVFGYKTVNSTPSTVFDNYQVNWVTNTAGTTESNSADWEYVSYKNLPFGTTTTLGGTLNNDGVAANASGSSTNITQSIKYWDFSASSYDFFAYSLGDGVTDGSTTWAKASALSNSTYTLEGTKEQLGSCYISKKKHIEPPSTSNTQVDLEFVNFLSKIQLMFYETIPGYSVKDVKFYVDGSTLSTGDAANDGLKPVIYGATANIASGGKYAITFDSNNNPVVTLDGTASSSESNVQFDAVSTSPNVWLSDYAGRDYKETEGRVYLGRTANAATATKQLTVLPNSTGATLTLKMDYTLLSRDNSGETIQVTGATATVPADFTKWQPNYVYTYIFKISDNTDGHIGSEVGLYPITLDAIVTDAGNGTQTTITTVTPTSITTYQKGAITNEYSAGNIYVVVGDGTTVLEAGTNAKLYTATVEEGAAQGLDASGNVAITEAMAANALTKTPDGSGNYVLTDANGKDLTVIPVAPAAADKLGILTAIPAADAPGGKELSVNCAHFAAADNTVYVFEYIKAAEAASYVAATGTFVSGTTYYTTDNTGASTVDTTGFEEGVTDVSSYFVLKPAEPEEKHYKVIKVGTPTPVTP